MSLDTAADPIGDVLPATPLLRLRPAPRTEPPCLDVPTIERMYAEAQLTAHHARHYVQPSIPLDGPGTGAELDFGQQPTARHDLPDPSTWVHRLMPALLECMSGLRPSSQVVRWVSQSTYQRIARRGAVARRRGVRGIQRPQVLKVHVCEPSDGVVEASVVVHHDNRVRAIALRLEGLDGRWVMTAFTVG
ncbi:Rv3235 family protein [Leekyejoonella antrihumi]|uniref:3-hydroxyacyl-CoA dehydrogenase n=1 Tax=Leekyejoonella antrihumi TaxID=1660198 RepID=A0A563DXV1_9MICO|nr:Rv3235 family protein [Leekyejoonella antrihumi]TWP35108.1 hypothetical protein FGL98_15275 [Leekyejoonella antrihumi]